MAAGGTGGRVGAGVGAGEGRFCGLTEGGTAADSSSSATMTGSPFLKPREDKVETSPAEASSLGGKPSRTVEKGDASAEAKWRRL